MSTRQTLQGALERSQPLRDIFKLYNIGAIAVNPQALRDLKTILLAAESYQEPVYIVIGRYGWAKDKNPLEAARKYRADRQPGTPAKLKTFSIYRAHPETEVHGDGSWSYPDGCEPILIAEGVK